MKWIIFEVSFLSPGSYTSFNHAEAYAHTFVHEMFKNNAEMPQKLQLKSLFNLCLYSFFIFTKGEKEQNFLRSIVRVRSPDRKQFSYAWCHRIIWCFNAINTFLQKGLRRLTLQWTFNVEHLESFETDIYALNNRGHWIDYVNQKYKDLLNIHNGRANYYDLRLSGNGMFSAFCVPFFLTFLQVGSNLQCKW